MPGGCRSRPLTVIIARMTFPFALDKNWPQYWERYSPWLSRGVNLALVVAVAGVLAQLVWALVPQPDWQPAPVTAVSAPVAAKGNNLQAILNAQLFGRYQVEQAPAATALSEAPDTRLNLTLVGILAGSSQRDSRALIAQSNGSEEPYALGADVIAGVSLQAIFPDRVILSRSGQLETLRLDRESTSRADPSVAVTTPAPAESGGTQQLAQIREQVLQDPSKASEYIRVQPTNENGQMRGYRIYPGRDRSIFNNAGLRPGDLVTAVNGIQLDDTQKALQTLNDLSQSNAITLTVERGGQTQTVNVSLN